MTVFFSFAPPRLRIDNTMVKVLARAFRWRKLLETGAFATVDEIAAAEKINPRSAADSARARLVEPAGNSINVR